MSLYRRSREPGREIRVKAKGGGKECEATPAEAKKTTFQAKSGPFGAKKWAKYEVFGYL
jgi:hypothetical protein